MELNDISPYAIILIYPDGFIEKAIINNNEFHMSYFIELKQKSDRLKKLVESNNINIPNSLSLANDLLTFGIDTELAKQGIIAIHSLFIDKELRAEFDDIAHDYYISMPKELSDKQRELFKQIIDCNDMTNSWYSVLSNGELLDVSFNDILDILDIKIK